MSEIADGNEVQRCQDVASVLTAGVLRLGLTGDADTNRVQRNRCEWELLVLVLPKLSHVLTIPEWHSI